MIHPLPCSKCGYGPDGLKIDNVTPGASERCETCGQFRSVTFICPKCDTRESYAAVNPYTGRQND